MRHKFNSILALPAVALTLLASGCGKENAATEGNFPTDGVIRVSTEVGAMTKGSFTTDKLKEFDLLVGNDPDITGQDVSGKYCYQNTKFTLENGEWTSAVTMLWQDASSEVTLLAVAPCFPEGERKSISDFYRGVLRPIKVEQTLEDTSADLLGWVSVYNFNPANHLDENGRVGIHFTHLLSKLTIVFNLGTEFNRDGVPSQNIVSDVQVGNVRLQARIFMAHLMPSPIFAYGDGPVGVVKPYHTVWTQANDKGANCVSEYECLLAPSSSGSPDRVEIGFKVDGIPYKVSESIEFQGGKSYTLTVNAGKDDVVAGTVSVAAWDGQDGGIFETE